jgi:hypothetical protein
VVQNKEEDESARAEAEYTLEYPARCPHCKAELEALRVARLLRTRVNFTSTLPRRGHVISCPECSTIISAELVGFAGALRRQAHAAVPSGRLALGRIFLPLQSGLRDGSLAVATGRSCAD